MLSESGSEYVLIVNFFVKYENENVCHTLSSQSFNIFIVLRNGEGPRICVQYEQQQMWK